MAICVVRWSGDGLKRWGRLIGTAPLRPDEIVQVEPLASTAESTAALISEFDTKAGLVGTGTTMTMEARKLVTPVTQDATLVCQGLNYDDHAAESGHNARKANLFFTKASSSLCGPYDDIVRPDGVELLDYESEVGILLRQPLKAGTIVTQANLGHHVAAVTLCNDVSARDMMFGASFLQWFQGKSCRTFCPTGPILYLMAPDEVATILDNLSFSLDYRGETRQSACSGQQIYKASETLTQLASFMDLAAGDLILTGTPGGVLAQGTPALAKIMATNLFDDVTRRAELVAESKRMHPFLQPGDTLTLRLRDDSNGVDLGGQFSRIV